ncbi:MAG: hypothetical protein ACKUBY_03075 [Candidatus Moraniibacteriota bacterium]|jgi:hypothetical protein
MSKDEFLMTKDDIEIVRNHMELEVFEEYSSANKATLLAKWRKEGKKIPVLTARDIPSLHNDGDDIMQEGRDY